MSNASPVKFGNANSGSTRDDALFLKVFAGEVITSFDRASKTEGADMVRSISNGKSASFTGYSTKSNFFRTLKSKMKDLQDANRR